MRKLSFLLISAGVLIVGFGLWQIWDAKQKSAEALDTAKAIVGQSERDTIDNYEENQASSFAPKMGEVVGILGIQALSAELPIVEGTNPDELAKGVGHFKGSFYPDQHGQIVLSGHRDTFFREVGKLMVGDILTLKVPYGEFQYEITGTKIVDKDDTSIITLQQDKEELVLTTCYPFRYVGNAPERYIIYAKKHSK